MQQNCPHSDGDGITLISDETLMHHEMKYSSNKEVKKGCLFKILIFASVIFILSYHFLNGSNAMHVSLHSIKSDKLHIRYSIFTENATMKMNGESIAENDITREDSIKASSLSKTDAIAIKTNTKKEDFNGIAVNIAYDNGISANEPEAKITNLNNTTGKALKDAEISKDSSKNLLKMKHKLPLFSFYQVLEACVI